MSRSAATLTYTTYYNYYYLVSFCRLSKDDYSTVQTAVLWREGRQDRKVPVAGL